MAAVGILVRTNTPHFHELGPPIAVILYSIPQTPPPAYIEHPPVGKFDTLKKGGVHFVHQSQGLANDN